MADAPLIDRAFAIIRPIPVPPPVMTATSPPTVNRLRASMPKGIVL